MNPVLQKHRQPDGGLVGGRPLHAVLAMGRDVEEVPDTQLGGLCLVLEAELCGPLQHDDPLSLVLIVPEPLGRGMAMRDDPFDADILSGEQRGEQLLGQLVRDVVE